ncbi:discoidin domain-containing protein [Solibaculum mannosilyticum]|uniref:discoidin domain-containing protein n=1 Tax=Solibaculum mannosilyticum TaxID=2780922 RepID=UPI0034AC03A9
MKKFISLCLCLLMVLSILPASTFSIALAEDTSVNLALGKPVTASQQYGVDGPEKAVDGVVSKDSKWSSNYFDLNKGAWMTVDLGEPCVIDRWVVYHAESGGEVNTMNTADFKLQVSSDGKNFTDVDSVTGNTDAVTDRTITPVVAQYVRLFVSKGGRHQDNVARINELEVYGSSLWTNVALGKTTKASQQYGVDGPEKAVDGVVSKDSKWSSNYFTHDGEWMMVDLGKEYTIARWVVYHAEAGGEAAWLNTRDFKLQKSQNGTDWSDVDVVTGNTDAVTDRIVDPFSARYVRLYVTHGGEANVARINEFELYATDYSENAALHKTATANMHYGADTPDKAVDGSTAKDDKWSSGFFDLSQGAWLKVDLGSTYVLDRWVVRHAQTGGEDKSMNTRDFKLQKSQNGIDWVDVDAVTGNTDAVTDRDVAPFLARYVRLFVTNGGSQPNVARINEFEVYGAPLDGQIEEDSRIRVMPLGDSITEGVPIPGGYRSVLKEYLSRDGIEIDFVGSHTVNSEGMDDIEHCGYGGWRIKSDDTSVSLYHHVEEWMNLYRPDVITLMAGTNDIWWEDHVNTEGLSAMIDKIFSVDPDVKLFVGSIAPIDESKQTNLPENAAQKAEQYNAAIPGIVAEKSAQGMDVTFVDINSVLTLDDLGDGVHPNQAGYHKAGAQWYSAISGTLKCMEGQWTNLSLNQSAASAAGDASLAIDGKDSTQWSAPLENGSADVTVDLGTPSFVGRYTVKHGGDNSSFTLQASDDGIEWTDVDTVTGNTADVTSRVVDTFTARYVRLHITEAAGNTANVAELELYGPATVQDTFQKRVYSDVQYEHDMPYRLYVPQNYDPTKSYPVVLFLHGAGERGTDNESILKANEGATVWAEPENQQRNECFVIAPQCPVNEQWVDTDWGKGSYDMDNVPISDEMEMVLDIVAQVKSQYNIDSTRMYSTGISMGGYGTWYLNTMFPDMFAAMVPICGAGDPSKAGDLGDKPIWVFHGDSDPTVPVSGSRDMVNALKALNANVTYTEYPGVGHDSWVQAYRTQEMIDWMFDQQAEPMVNVALGADATASANFTNEEPDKAVDGTVLDNSKWCGNSQANPDWIQLDLGETHTISRWVVRHAGAGGETSLLNSRDFTLQKSDNGIDWVDVDIVTDNVADVTDRYVPAFDARYIRLYITTKGSKSGDTAARVFELELYEKASSEPSPVTVQSVEDFEGISVPFGTQFADLKDLPQSAKVTLSDGSTMDLDVTWSEMGYHPNEAGNYTLSGTLSLPDGVENPLGLKASFPVTVEEQIIPSEGYRLWADQESYEVDGDIILHATTPLSVRRIAIFNENNKGIGILSLSSTVGDGVKNWDIKIRLGTAGLNRTLTLGSYENNQLVLTDATVSFDVVNPPLDVEPAIFWADFDKTSANVNEEFTIIVCTSTSVGKLSMVNERGRSITTSVVGYEDKGDTRIWTLKASVGSAGFRIFSFRAADLYGQWISDTVEQSIRITA